MTAAKVMDVVARLPGCVALTVEAVTHGNDLHDTNGPSHDQTLRTSGSFRTILVRTPACWPLVGQTNLHVCFFFQNMVVFFPKTWRKTWMTAK